MSDTVTEDMVLAKELENAQRREQLLEQQRQLPRGADREPNFPPECCCIKPVIYHNIKEQVPAPHQKFMYMMAGLYIALLVLIVYNIVTALVAFILGGAALHFGLSFLYLLGIPGAWMMWYYNVYCGIVYASRARQIFSLFGIFIGFAFDAWMAVGVANFGGCGWIFAFLALSNTPVFIMSLVCAILWTIHGIFMLVMFIRFWKASASLIKGGINVYRDVIV